MKLSWYKDLGSRATVEDKKKRTEEVTAHSSTLYLLYSILEEKIPEFVPVTDYEDPSWAYKQADRNGYVRAIREVLALIDVHGTKTDKE